MILSSPRTWSVLAFRAAVGLVVSLPSTALAQSSAGDLAIRASATRPVSGDKVAVRVYGDPALSDMATVDEKGRITLPRIGMLQADAVSIAALRDTIRTRYSAILREPAIDVTVLRRVIVSGEVAKPGVYYADLTTSIGEIVAMAGGLRETGSSGKVYRLRGTERSHIQNWQADQSPEADLRSGDQILVGRKSWLELNIIPFSGLTLSVVSLVISLRPR
jgi:protein involved in polysaccharide export with SLBB domain